MTPSKALFSAVLASCAFAIAACDRNGTMRTSDTSGPTDRTTNTTGTQDRGVIDNNGNMVNPSGVPGSTNNNSINATPGVNNGVNNGVGTSGNMNSGVANPSLNANDTRISSDFRRILTDETSLSTNARNVTIDAQNGVVTLRGTVASNAEKDLLESRARSITGVSSVNNQLTVQTP